MILSSPITRSGMAAGIAAWIGIGAIAVGDPGPPDRPLLWRIEGNGLQAPSHLFGTIHFSNDRIARLHPAADRAFRDAQVFHAELSMELKDQMAIAMAMMRRDGKSLGESIGPELSGELDAYLKGVDPQLNAAILQPMKTWAAAMTVVMLPMQMQGGEALDLLLWKKAKEAGKRTGALESAEDQLAAFEILNEEEQTIYLRETLRLLNKEKDPFADLIAAYESGDEQKLHELLMESMKLDAEDPKVRRIGERLIESLLTRRDEKMAAKIHEALAADPKVCHFFAAGAAHFLGANSVRNHLEAKGYVVTRIQQ